MVTKPVGDVVEGCFVLVFAEDPNEAQEATPLKVVFRRMCSPPAETTRDPIDLSIRENPEIGSRGFPYVGRKSP